MPERSFFALTGAPGAGKTSTLDAIAARGATVSPEGARAIIRAQAAIEGRGLPWRDPALFAELMLAFDLQAHALARGRPGPVIFDRGIPDVIGYLNLCGLPVPAHVRRAAARARYARIVFAAPPWQAVFRQDAERRQDFAEARRSFAAVTAAWAELGYEIVPLPLDTPQARAAFVLDRIGFRG